MLYATHLHRRTINETVLSIRTYKLNVTASNCEPDTNATSTMYVKIILLFFE